MEHDRGGEKRGGTRRNETSNKLPRLVYKFGFMLISLGRLLIRLDQCLTFFQIANQMQDPSHLSPIT